MTEEQAKKGQELLEEIKELKKIDKLLEHKEYRGNVNVVFRQHYGECKDYERVVVEKRHFKRFMELLNQVIGDVEQELQEL